MPGLTRLAILCLGLLTIWGVAARPAQADGIHLVVIQPQDEETWLVHEFIDNSVVGKLIQQNENSDLILEPSVGLEGAAEDVTVLSVQTQPSIVYIANYVEPLENRLAAAGQALEAIILERHYRTQVMGGLFGVPFWPFLAASEVPVRGIDLGRSHRLPHWRESLFPAAVYVGEGDVPDWEIVGFDGKRALVRETGQDGSGAGIVFDYFMAGSFEGAGVRLATNAEVAALYASNTHEWVVSRQDAVHVSHAELISALDKTASNSSDVVKCTALAIHDQDGSLGRYLLARAPVGEPCRVAWELTNVPVEGSEQVGLYGMVLPLAIVACWLLFGLVIIAGNWLYRFTSLPTMVLLTRSLAAYPLYLAVSFLLAGLWGMGFVPAGILVARIISAEGGRLPAFGTVLASSFLVAIVSRFIGG